MSPKNTLPTPGARESNAGDRFHVLWAARRAVQLLNPRSNLQRVFMEGLSPVDVSVSEIDDDFFLGVDLSEYYGGDKFETASRIELSQLKYSTRHPNKAWTTSRLCAAKNTQGTDSVIRRLADIYKGFLSNHSREDVLKKLCIRLVSNQPVVTELLWAIKSAQDLLTETPTQAQQLLKQLSEDDRNQIKPFQNRSNLSSTEFTDFLRVLDLSYCGEESRKFQRLQLIQDLSASVSHDPVATLRSLCELIEDEAQPDKEGSIGLSVEDIIACLGVGHRDNLFPAPSRLDTARRPVMTRDAQNLADTIVSASSRKVLAHGMAGIGKTTTVQSLVARLPPHSVVIIYDCYGGGGYKDFGEQRHTPQRAFLQLSNELAIRCGSPFLVQLFQNIPDLQRHFTRSVEMAAKIVAEQGRLLVIAIDAADNAITAAIESGDEKSCFVPNLWTIALPENCRLLMTARSHRCESLQPTPDVDRYLLQGFDRQASMNYLKYSFPNADERSGEVFHEKTSGNPRVQFYLLDKIDAESINSTTLARLLEVARRTPNQIFEDLLNAAIPKDSNLEINRQKLATLVYLNRPVPIHIFAGTCEIGLDEARRFCQALEPGIILGDEYFSFRDEDFETYLRDQIAVDEVILVQDRLGNYFLDRATHDDYSARVVAEHLFLAERYQDVIQLAIDSAELPITDELLRSQIRHSRIVLAMQSACKSNKNAEAVRLVLLAAEAKRSNNAFKALVRKNPELAAKYGDTVSIAYFHQKENDTWMGSIHFRMAVMYARDPAYRDRAEEQLKLANAWIRRWMALPKAERHQWRLDNIDIACGAEAIFWLKGAQECQHWLSKWRPIDTVIKATEHLVKSLVRQIDTAHKEQLFTELRLPLWAKALFLSTVGAINPNLSNTLVQQLDRTLASLDEIIQRDQKDKNLQTKWAIDLCELAVRHGLDIDRTLRLLETICPKPLEEYIHSHFDLPNHFPSLRTAYLKSILSNMPITEEDWLPEKHRHAEEGNTYQQSEIKRYKDIIRKLLKVHEIKAMTILHPLKVSDISETLSSDLNNRLQQTTYRRFEPDFYYGAWATIACEALLNCVDDASSMLIEIANASARIMPGASPKFWMDMARRFLHHERYRSIGFDLLERAANYIMDNPNPGQERWETLLTCAEIVSPYDAVQGQDYYKRSLAAADRIDDDSIHLLSFQADLACQVADTLTIEQRQDYSVQLACTVVAFKEYVSDDSELPWEKTIAAVTCLDPANGIALCSQWDDENHLALDDGIIPVVRETVRSQWIKPLEGLALLRLPGKHYDISELAIDLLDRQLLEGVNARPQLVQLLQEISFWIRRDLPLKDRQQAATRILDWGKTHRLEQFAGMAELRDLLSLVTSIPVKEESDRMPSYFDESRRNSLKQAELDRTNTVAQARSSIVDLVRNGSFDLLATQLFIISRNSYGKEIPEILNIVGASIIPSQRIDFLNALVSIELNFSLIISVVGFLKIHLEKWKNSGQIKEWMPMGMAKLLEKNLPKFLVPLSYGLDIALDDVLSFANFPQGNRTEIVLSSLVKHLDVLSAQELYRVAKCIAPAIPGIDLSATFEWSLQRTEAQIEREKRTLIPPVFIASSGSSATLANFFWALFGHPDKCIRWQALHAARAIAIQPNQLLIDELMRLSTTRSATGFRSERLEFYWMSARTWLMLLIQRLADECPQVLKSHAQEIAAHALDRDFPHVQIRELAKQTALRLVENIPGCLTAKIIEQLHFTNIPLSCLYPKTRSDRRANVSNLAQRIQPQRSFQLNSIDTIPYWYNPASHVFDYVTPDVTDRSEQWICDRWGRTDSEWHDDIRDLSKRHDWQSKSNRHGSVPRIENLKTYLEYHAMFCAVGEMLDRKIPIDGDNYTDTDCPLQYWLGKHLSSSNDYWVSDLRSPTPHRLDCWGEFSSIDIKQWLEHKEPEAFDSGLGLSEKAHAREITVLGDISIRDSLRNSYLSVRSSLVNPIGARSLLHALQTTDSRDFQLPVADRGTSEFEIDESGFELTALMREVWSWDETLDTFDPLSRDRGFRLEDFQPHFIEMMKLQPKNRTEYLRKNGEMAARLELWSDDLDEEYISHPYSSGERWWVRIDLLLEYLRQCDSDLIIEIQIKRNRNERNRTEVAEEYQYDPGKSRIYILRQNGILETLDSHRDIRTAAR
jgi:hypothetical protein